MPKRRHRGHTSFSGVTMPAKRKPRRPKKVQEPLQTDAAPLIKRIPNKHGGKPQVELTDAGWDQVKRWASVGASMDDIADALGIARNTMRAPHLQHRFDEVIRQAYASRRLALREKMMTEAEANPGRRAAQKLMGPVLGWYDRLEMSGPQGNPIEFATQTREAAIETIMAALSRTSGKKNG